MEIENLLSISPFIHCVRRMPFLWAHNTARSRSGLEKVIGVGHLEARGGDSLKESVSQSLPHS